MTTAINNVQVFDNLDGSLYYWQSGMRTYAIIRPNGDINRCPLPSEEEVFRRAKDPDDKLGDFWATVYVNHDFNFDPDEFF